MNHSQRISKNRRGLYYVMLYGLSDKESVIRFIENSDEYNVINIAMQSLMYGLLFGICIGVTIPILVSCLQGVVEAPYWLPVTIPAVILLTLCRKRIKSLSCKINDENTSANKS